MSALELRSPAADADATLVRLLPALWRVLPVLALTGAGTVAVTFAALWLVGSASPLLPLLIGVPAAPFAAIAVRRLGGEIGGRREGVSFRDVHRATRVLAVPALACSLALAAADIAIVNSSWLLAAPALVGAAASLIAALGGLVALPLAVERTEARLSSVWRVALHAVSVTPVPPLGALVFLIVASWAALGHTAGLFVVVPGLGIALGCAAARVVLTRIGVDAARRPVGPAPSIRTNREDLP